MTLPRIVLLLLALLATSIHDAFGAGSEFPPACGHGDIGGRFIVGVRGDREFVFWRVPGHGGFPVTIDEKAFASMRMPLSERIESLVVVPSRRRVELLVRADDEIENSLFRRYIVQIGAGNDGAVTFGKPLHNGNMFSDEGHLLYGKVGDETGSFVVSDSGEFSDFFDVVNIQEVPTTVSISDYVFDEAEEKSYPRWSEDVISDSSLEKVKWNYGVLFRYAGEQIVAQNRTTRMGEGAISYSVQSESLNCTFAVLDGGRYKLIQLLPVEIELEGTTKQRRTRSAPASGNGTSSSKSQYQAGHRPFPYITILVVNVLLPLFLLVLCLIVYYANDMEEKVKESLYEYIDEFTIGEKKSSVSTGASNKLRIGVAVALCLVAAVVIACSSFMFYRFANNYVECIDFSDAIYVEVNSVLSEEEPINGASYKLFREMETHSDYVDRCLFWPNDTECLHDMPGHVSSLEESLEPFEYMEACAFADFSKLIKLGSDLAILRAKSAQLQSLRARCRPFYNRLNECGTGSYVNTKEKRSRSVREINEALTWDVYFEKRKG